MIADRSLEDWARRAPDKTAIIDGGQSMTFSEWNAAADGLAHGLAARGLAEGDILACRTRTRFEWPVIQQACAKLGVRLLVMNWRLTTSEVDFVLRDSGAAAFICDDIDPSPMLPVLRGLKLTAALDSGAEGFTPFQRLFRDGPPLFAQSEVSLIVYTSGTTGFPKGVESLPKPQQKPSSSDADVMLINMPMHHASAPNQLNRGRFNGWTVVLQRRFDPEDTLALIERHRVSQWGTVPTMFKRIFGLPPEALNRYDVSSIRLMTTGGGPSPDGLKAQVIAHFGPKLAENYGATEVGMMTNLPAEMILEKPGSCGRLNPGVEMEIRDETGNVLPTGEVGIIWTRTPTTIAKYLNKSAEDRLDERGFFKVGDLGRFDADGYLYLTDRAIDLIVSGGVNIYPAEIEAVLMKHDAVQDAAVVGAPNDEFGEEVRAFVELKPDRAATVEDLAMACADLASYKRPRRIEIVEALPRNTMGKLLKRELRAPLWAGRERAI